MDALTIIRKLLVRAALLLGILVALTLIINLAWFDERLHPDVAALLPPRSVAMEDNAFPLVYGFPAANDRSSREAGLAIVARLRERFAAGRPVSLSSEELAELLGEPGADSAWRESLRSHTCNSRFELDCADRLIADVGSADVERQQHVHPRLAVLLRRYAELLEAATFEENQEFDATTPLPDYGLLMLVSRVAMALSFRDDSSDDFLAHVAGDVAFWKRVLRDGHSLVAKMVALAGLRNDTTFLATLLRSRNLSDEQLDRVARIFAPLTEAERDIGETFLAEARIVLLSDRSLAEFIDGAPGIAALAMQENATLNEYYVTTTTPLRLRASLDAEEFYRTRGHEPLSYSVRAFPPPLYNLGGKFVLEWMASELNMQDYISRVHDLDGRLTLIRLQAEIARNPQRRIEAVVASSAQRNPYTRAPMAYDSAAGTLGFDCLANAADTCAVRLH